MTLEELLKKIRELQTASQFMGKTEYYSVISRRDFPVVESLIRQYALENRDRELQELKKESEEMRIKVDEQGFIPYRAHSKDAGLDLMSPERVTLRAQDSVVIDTGVHVELPEGTVGMIKSKSGLNVKHGITSEGVIDVGYTGSIKVKLYNFSDEDYEIQRGDKISQLVIMPMLTPALELVDELEKTDRGNNGFGSTGR